MPQPTVHNSVNSYGSPQPYCRGRRLLLVRNNRKWLLLDGGLDVDTDVDVYVGADDVDANVDAGADMDADADVVRCECVDVDVVLIRM